MKIESVTIGTKKKALGYMPLMNVYEGDRFLWQQSEPIHFVNREDALNYAKQMRTELLTQNKINTQEVA